MASTLVVATGLTGNTGDNTSFRAYGTAVSNAFANSGWVKAGDSGQIDWTTVVANGTPSNVAGYEIWHMNDALQNTTPVYLKVSYRTGTAIPNTPMFEFQIGSGTDTLGNLTGVTSLILTMYSNLVGVNQPCFFVGTSSRFVMALWTNVGTTGPQLFSIERTHDAGGNDTTDGVMMMVWGYNNASLGSQLYWTPIGTPGNVTENFGVFAATNTMTANLLQLYPQFYCNGLFTNPSLNVLWAISSTVTSYVPVTIPFYGSTRKYLPTFTIAYAALRVGNVTIYPMILWE